MRWYQMIGFGFVQGVLLGVFVAFLVIALRFFQNEQYGVAIVLFILGVIGNRLYDKSVIYEYKQENNLT